MMLPRFEFETSFPARRLTPVLKRVCKKHGVSYHAYPSLFQSLKAHLLVPPPP
jgi:hypothetical protein